MQQLVPVAAPDDLDHVPAGAAEERLQLLDDLAVAADRAVEPLQVAVDDEGQVVQAVDGGDVDQAARLDLVHLAVAEERPDVLVGGVLDAAVLQVPVEAGLLDRVHRAEAHGHRRVLPEVRHQPRVRVGRDAAAGVRVLLAESVQVVLGQPALEERPRVHPGGGVALEEDMVAAAGVVLAAPEVVEADLVQGRRGRVGRDVPADTETGPLRPVHHDRGVPPDPAAVPPFDLLVTGEERLRIGGDGVDVVGGREGGQRDVLLLGPASSRSIR